MAFPFETITLDVYEGPSRWDTLLSSVWEGKPVRFRLSGSMICFPDQKPSEWLSVRIMGVDRIGEHRRNGSCDLMALQDAEILMPSSEHMVGLTLTGNYDMRYRKGQFRVDVRNYEGGDYFGGWKPGGKEFITGPEVITFVSAK